MTAPYIPAAETIQLLLSTADEQIAIIQLIQQPSFLSKRDIIVVDILNIG